MGVNDGLASAWFLWNPISWIKELFPGRRSVWVLEAELLRIRMQPWGVGRTDLVSYDCHWGIIEHFAYGPDGQQKQFLGRSALRSAVRYARRMNRDYSSTQSGIFDIATCPVCGGTHFRLTFFRMERPLDGCTIWARCPSRSNETYCATIRTCHARLCGDNYKLWPDKPPLP